MKGFKLLLLIFIFIIPATLASCTLNQSTAYQELAVKDKQKIKFVFTLNQDESEDQTPDPVYMIDAKITNKTDKTVSFNLDKFKYVIGDQTTSSEKAEKITIEPGESKKVNNLFTHINEQETVGGGVIEYMDSKNVLAQANFSNPTSSVTVSGGTNQAQSTTNNDGTSSNNSENANHHNTKEEAMEILQSKQYIYGFTEPVQSMQAKEMGHAWIFITYVKGEEMQLTVLDNGEVRCLYGNF